ncbi:MAG: polysaccharide biosynthesis/export family protein [Sedimentisphaerales bacterium]|nr:polysaccharide biosynthesis/export family protein [Sedimentisphaerales bacterium]
MVKIFRILAVAAALFSVVIFGNGCSDGDYLDPTQVGRFRPVPAVNVILDSLGVAEETPATYVGAEDPKPMDAMVLERDYAFHSGDVVRISVYELEQEGQTYINDFQVSETGKISIPQVGQIQAAGLTESQLEDEIRQILSPAILKDPFVTVLLQNSQSRVFTILGEGVPKPDRYSIPRYDFRLADALAVAGSPRQFNVTYIYVTREVTGKEAQAILPPPEADIPTKDVTPGVTPESEMEQLLQPHAHAAQSQTVVSAAEMAAPETAKPAAHSLSDQMDSDLDSMLDSTKAGDVAGPASAQTPLDETGPVEWIFRDGKWSPVRQGEGAPPQMPTQLPTEQKPETVSAAKQPVAAKEDVPAAYGMEQIGAGGQQKRVIKIPVKEFLGGDPRYNIIIKPGDVISVPVDVVGEFYVLGNANNQGVINLTGRPMTLMQSMAAAGGLGPLAWPERIEVRRRVGDKKEEIVLVNLKNIAAGSQPDFFIKPNDLINIGTHPGARWLAVLRNAFRATYGFGFIYDRNFADRDYGGNPLPF